MYERAWHFYFCFKHQGLLMKIRYACGTHVGMRRAHNEDNFLLLAEENLYLIADGMGGHACGEVASEKAVETLAEFFLDTARDKEGTWPFKENHDLNDDENRLVTGIKLANKRIHDMAKSQESYNGMGTTIVSLLLTARGAYTAHVGDSRCYMVRRGQLQQLTRDHSLLNDYLKLHTLNVHEIENFPHKNVIVRALGMKETVQVDIQKINVLPDDLFLLCSDGLSSMLEESAILDIILQAGNDLEKCCQNLIQQANDNGGQDNITVILVSLQENEGK